MICSTDIGSKKIYMYIINLHYSFHLGGNVQSVRDSFHLGKKKCVSSGMSKNITVGESEKSSFFSEVLTKQFFSINFASFTSK